MASNPIATRSKGGTTIIMNVMHSFVSASRCASCIGESARAAWYRHSDGWRGAPPPGPRRSPWDSLPSLRHEGSLNDSGYRSNRADSFEQSPIKSNGT
ncbi:hypothetical protein HF086_010797 [Spodoptera exigua]|uniref:Uncharacterized protein n=1 Tax=Spodoptera exigua TaxID=7107 RepID=A0A922M0L6_SPOEX|nr:hypothetical protein HF086_010797 [Spodoptera exigua]